MATDDPRRIRQEREGLLEILTVLQQDADAVAAARALGIRRGYAHTLTSAYDTVMERQNCDRRIHTDSRLGKSVRFYPGARVGYRPDPKRGVQWTGTVIVRPKGEKFPLRSLVTRGELTYVIKDGTTDIKGCFARNLERRYV